MAKQPTVTKSVKADSIIILYQGDDDSSADYMIDYADPTGTVRTLPCTESFYSLAEKMNLTHNKMHTYTLWLNSNGEIYNYDKTLKRRYSFMEDESEKEAEARAGNPNASMIVTYNRSNGEVNIIRPFPSLSEADKVSIVETVARDFDELKSQDVLHAKLIIDEVRERSNLKSFYVST